MHLTAVPLDSTKWIQQYMYVSATTFLLVSYCNSIHYIVMVRMLGSAVNKAYYCDVINVLS